MNVYENLKKMGLELPEAPPKGGIYVPVKQVGNLLYTSGIGPIVNGRPLYTGKLGKDITIAQGQEAARVVILNMMRVLEDYLKDLNRVKNVVKMLAFIASAPEFSEQPQVVNGASQLLVDLFGTSGEHARSAIGTNELPGNIPIEIEVVFEI